MRQAIARALDGGLPISPQLLRFATVGAITTALDFVLFLVLVPLTGIPAVANLLSYSCGIAVSYALNSAWTFRVGRDPASAVRFTLATLAGLALSTLLVALLVLVMWPFLAKILSVPVVFAWNYLAVKYWVFARR